MSVDVKGKPKKCILDENECVSLLDILNSFNTPVSEEHAWALCFQCAKCLKNVFLSDRTKCRVVQDLRQVKLHRDGHVHSSTVFAGGGRNAERPEDAGTSRSSPVSEEKLVIGLGFVVFHALDFGIDEEEERHLQTDLETLISNMTACDEVERQGCGTAETDDEGIERDACEGEVDDDHTSSQHQYTLDTVLKVCCSHIGAGTIQQADNHYRAVCRALVAEAIELTSFLEKVSQGTKDLRDKADAVAPADLDNLNLTDWARLWVQVIRELRHGVQLKKVCYSRRPIAYELTPYEILMEDIRSRRYKLNKVMIDGNIPHRVKKDAHAIILEFIRSRPPLRKASERKLAPKISQPVTPRERLLESIKQREVKLRPATPFSRNSGLRASLNKKVMPVEADEPSSPGTPPLKATRRLIKVDFSALQTDDDDDDDEEEEEGDCGENSHRQQIESSSKGRHNPWHRTGTTLTHDEYHSYCDTALECRVPSQSQNTQSRVTTCRIL